MGSDILAKLRLVTIPSWSKYFFFVVLLLIGMINTAIFAYGVMNFKDSLVEATLKVLAVFLPIFAIFFVTINLKTGEAAILRNIGNLFTDVIPGALKKIEDRDYSFYDPDTEVIPKEGDRQINVLTNYHKGAIHADFLVEYQVDKKAIPIRLEVNYKRVNFNLYLSPKLVGRIIKKPNVTLAEIQKNNHEITAAVIRAFSHSIGGAQYEDKVQPGAGNEAIYQSGYSFNTEMISRPLAGKPRLCLVGIKSVSDNFIWDPSEKYYFANDLTLMLRAMVAELPEIASAL